MPAKIFLGLPSTLLPANVTLKLLFKLKSTAIIGASVKAVIEPDCALVNLFSTLSIPVIAVYGIPSYNRRSPTSTLAALPSRTMLSLALLEEPSVPFKVMGRLNDSADTSEET